MGYTRLGAGLEGRDTLSRWGGSGGRGGRRVEVRRGRDGNRVCAASIMFCPCQNLQRRERHLVCNSLHGNGRGSGVQLNTLLTFFRMRELTLGRGIRSPGSWPRSVWEVRWNNVENNNGSLSKRVLQYSYSLIDALRVGSYHVTASVTGVSS